MSVAGTTTTTNTEVVISEQMQITNAGTGPALVVTQTGTNDIADFRDETGSVLKILDSGNVGIGTATPSQKLRVQGTFYTSGLATLTGATISQGSTLSLRGDGGGTTNILTCLDSGGASKLIIDSQGWVGIGTGAPSTAFHCYDGSTFTGTITANGGIITTTLQASGYIKSGNCAFMAYGNSTGAYNDATGSVYVLAYTQETHDTGARYNNSSSPVASCYSFSAPVAGVYTFSANASIAPTKWLAFRKNRASVWYGLTQNMSAGYTYTSISQTMKLAADDYIQVVSLGDTTADGNTFFSGALLFATA
jgi:hypothetical protein